MTVDERILEFFLLSSYLGSIPFINRSCAPEPSSRAAPIFIWFIQDIVALEDIALAVYESM